MKGVGFSKWGRWIYLILLGLGDPVSLLAQGDASPAVEIALSPDEQAWLRGRKVIRYGSDPAWPPFSMRTRNGLEGIDRDLAELFEARLGVEFEYVPTSSWEATLEKLGRGEIDFVTGFANLRERPVEALYTQSYTAFPLVTIMRNDGPFFTSLEQIERRGLTVAAPAGYAPTIYIEQNYPGIRLLRTGTAVEALRHVSEGSADVAVENLGVAAHLIRENGLLNLKITGPTRHHFDPALGVAPAHPELRSILDKALASVTRQEQLEIYQKWVLVEVSGLWGWRRVALLCGLILAIAALVIGLIFSSNRRLAAELKMRREVEESLRQSEERFRHLFERMDEAYFLTHTDGKIQFVNETTVEVLGIGSRPVVERLSLLTFLQRPGDLVEIVEALRSGEKIRDREVVFIRADGSAHPCQCQIRLLPGSGESTDEDGIEWLARGAG